MNAPFSTDTILSGQPRRAAPLAILGKPTHLYGSIEHRTQLEIRRYIKEGKIKPDMVNANGTGIIIPADKADYSLGETPDSSLDGRGYGE